MLLEGHIGNSLVRGMRLITIPVTFAASLSLNAPGLERVILKTPSAHTGCDTAPMLTRRMLLSRLPHFQALKECSWIGGMEPKKEKQQQN